jgi:hypothetical protein
MATHGSVQYDCARKRRLNRSGIFGGKALRSVGAAFLGSVPLGVERPCRPKIRKKNLFARKK